MKIQDLEYLEATQQSIYGGFVVNKLTIISLARSLSVATAVAYYGDSGARAISKNNIIIGVEDLPF